MDVSKITGFEMTNGDQNERLGFYDRKTLVIWASEPSVIYPIALVHKPRNLTNEEWLVVVAALRRSLSITGLLLTKEPELAS